MLALPCLAFGAVHLILFTVSLTSHLFCRPIHLISCVALYRLKKLEQARGGNKASSGAAGISAAASSSPTGLRQGKGSPNLSRASSNAGNERQEGSPTKKARTGTSGSDGSKCGTSPKVSKGIKAAKGMQESQQREIMDAAPSPSSSDVEVMKVRHSTSGPEAGNSDDEYAVYFEELPK